MSARPGVPQRSHKPAPYAADSDWRARSVCVHADPELFSATETDYYAVQQAKRVCRGCPVIAECLAHALAAGESGIWGATTAFERALLKHGRKPKPPRKSCVVCGDPVAGHGRSRYCSNACSRKRTCQDCGVEFTGAHRSRFCSRCRRLRRVPKEYATAVTA